MSNGPPPVEEHYFGSKAPIAPTLEYKENFFNADGSAGEINFYRPTIRRSHKHLHEVLYTMAAVASIAFLAMTIYICFFKNKTHPAKLTTFRRIASGDEEDDEVQPLDLSMKSCLDNANSKPLEETAEAAGPSTAEAKSSSSGHRARKRPRKRKAKKRVQPLSPQPEQPEPMPPEEEMIQPSWMHPEYPGLLPMPS